MKLRAGIDLARCPHQEFKKLEFLRPELDLSFLPVNPMGFPVERKISNLEHMVQEGGIDAPEQVLHTDDEHRPGKMAS
ncbi:hypothetical protein LZK73_09795 [Neorhizobium galegae]|nr:hypothetical protein LZK73_09795 [Neorhizobium galegae]